MVGIVSKPLSQWLKRSTAHCSSSWCLIQPSMPTVSGSRRTISTPPLLKKKRDSDMGKSFETYGAAPIVFADQPAELLIGPFTSKLTLGVVEDDGTDVPRPVVTLVMPTPMLFHMARDILKQATSPAVKRSTVKALLSAAKSIEADTNLYELPSVVEENQPPPRRKRISKS